MFWGLSSNILHVNAAVSSTWTKSIDVVGGNIFNRVSGNSSQVFTISAQGDTMHIEIPFQLFTSWSNLGFSSQPSGNDWIVIGLAGNHSIDATVNGLGSNGGYSVVNRYIKDDSGNVWGLSDSQFSRDRFPALVKKASSVTYGTNFNMIFWVCYDVSWYSRDWTSYSFTLDTTFTGTFNGRLAGADEIQQATTQVVDTAANQSLDAIEQSSQQIATSVTSDTGGGLLATIKNFFGGFFSNLINSILGLFVPSSDYFSTWFSNLNTLLSDKLGMLYAPFDLLISTLNAIYSADTTEPGIVFPGFDWDGQTVIEPFTFYFSSLGDQFETFREAVYFSTDVIFLFAFLYLMQKKIALVLTGSEVNG